MKSISIISSILFFMSFHLMPITCQYQKKHLDHRIHGQIDSDLLTKMHFTQKGYIQFLRYIVDVPVMTEYTFCLWMKSYNLTYSHPLLSYSKHEEERRIRVWISPLGKAINLEINGVEVFSIPMKFREHQWYHICQSWSSDQAVWELFVNGRKTRRGYAPKLFGVQIASGGDIVVGQEYTDFDKGLDDGIEGDIFGFNMVLSASSHDFTQPSTNLHNSLNKRSSHPQQRIIKFKNSKSRREVEMLSSPILNSEFLPSIHNLHISRFKPPRKITMVDLMNVHPKKEYHHSIVSIDKSLSKSNGNRKPIKYSKSIGRQLVELSGNCRVGKGAPLNGGMVLINWTKTTVRVFGGAIIKHVKPFC
ncbi:hypothetical protein WA026_003446 [Henosepilachna vigintioctopunctata]|uniref:Pentraxin (PTX) domain-containing protein n=1 Tax=Henosepilachna vigintioctopunctata TaxID=420089 RepID=A0AAW1TNF1_9CUCU